jgi:cyanophycin synthetase
MVGCCNVQYSDKTREYKVFIGYEESETVLYAGEVAAELLNAIASSNGVPDEDVIAGLRTMLDELLVFSFPRRLDPNSRLLMQAAQQLDIPVVNLEQPPFECTTPDHIIQNGYLQFGWGTRMQRCVGALPFELFSDAVLKTVFDRAHLLPVLRDAGIPLPEQDPEFINRNQVRRAQRSARRIGYPVTIRPRYCRKHEYCFNENNVFGPLADDSRLATAVTYIREILHTDVWVESCVAGDHYQFLVLGGEVVSVIRTVPPAVTGDGEHSIRWLASRQAAQAANAPDTLVWKTLAAGDNGENCRLQLSGMTVDSIPEQDAEVALRAEGSFYNGGTCQDVTDRMPAGFRDIALKAAEVLELSRIAGVSLVINDLSGTATAPNCAVTLVVPDPDLQAHAQPGTGDPHNVPARFLGQLFPAGENGRIPVISITGTNGKTTTSRMVAVILKQAGYKVGLSCSDGVYINGEMNLDGDRAGSTGAFWVFVDPAVEVAVLETARGGMANTGIAYDQCDIGACLNIAADHIGLNNINSLDEMAVHKRQVIERTTGTAVLNAEDPRCLAMREHTPAQHIVLVARSAAHPEISNHCEAGGTAIVVDPPGADGNLCICDSSGITPLLSIQDIPATWSGMAFHNVDNALFAAAISLGMGVDREALAEGLRSFSTSPEYTPGRLNIYDGLPFQVILDYAHNAHGIQAFCEFSNQLPVTGHRILVIRVAGDRSVQEIEESAAAAADSFDYFICTDPYDLRGRNPGDIAGLLKAGLMKHSVSGDQIELVTDQEKGLQRALETASNGDLLVVFGKHYEKARDTIKKYGMQETGSKGAGEDNV